MRIRRTTAVIIIFAVLFIAANVIALPFANFGTYSALWAQVYGNTQSVPACAPGSSEFLRLSDADAQALLTPFPPPTSDAQMVATYVTSCFGLNGIALSDFETEGLTCDNAVAYRIEVNGNRQRWPITCDPDGKTLWIPGTGERGHIQLFKIGDASDAPAGVELSHGA
ncbi:MAG TPA: hypothetical protein VG897_13785 [Terriglobales bacterium]|nr:hypothetical protein [Terriglobales bacterium]